ncbi:MAG: hypothetical protein WC342_00615 [Methanoregula sp.]|jgi:hypothetical protein
MKSTVKNTGIFGGAKPRRPQALFLVLVVVGLLALAGVVSADPYYMGEDLATIQSGTGDISYNANDCWVTTTDVIYHSNTTTFQVPATAINNVSWARLYVTVYMGNMNTNYYGNETITFGATPLATAQPLHLAYDRTSGATHTSPGGYFTDLNRVTSDYINTFDVTNLITSQNIQLTTETWNESDSELDPGVGKFDGRIKGAILVVAYNDGNAANDVNYWVNPGHDTVTKYWLNPAYISNTTFATGSVFTQDDSTWTGTLYVPYLASADGSYEYSVDGGSTLTNLASNSPGKLGTYLGRDSWTVNGAYLQDLTFYYNRSSTQSYYKIPLAVLTAYQDS